MDRMDLFFCGKILPEGILEKHYQELSNTVSLAGNTFFSSIIAGLSKNGCNVSAISFFDKNRIKDYISEYNGDINFVFYKRSSNRLIQYLNIMRQVTKEIIRFKKESDADQKAVIFSVLGYSYSIPGIIICKLLKVYTIAIITDVPGYRTEEATTGFLSRIGDKIGRVLLNHFDAYVLLSEAMKDIVNVHGKKSTVVEGIFKQPDNLIEKDNALNLDANIFYVMYAGSLDYEYGIMNLVKAVLSIDDERIKLVIYGSGEAEKEIQTIEENTKRLCFMGRVSHEEVVLAERKMSLLVNPRPVKGKYVKYSFPSKIMEYMASGTPVLLTDIPSLPEEYKEFVNIIKGNNIEALKKAICDIAYDNYESQRVKAKNARRFIELKKNEVVQTRKIVELIPEPNN